MAKTIIGGDQSYLDASDAIKTRVVSVVITRPLPIDGGMKEDHGAPETVLFCRLYTEKELLKTKRYKESITESYNIR